MRPDQVPLFEQGIELFNRQEFFECHEVLEAVWTPARGPERLFLQGLIHFAAPGLMIAMSGPSAAVAAGSSVVVELLVAARVPDDFRITGRNTWWHSHTP